MAATAGTNELVRLGSRRDRIVLPAWIYLMIALSVGTAYSFRGLYPTAASRLAFARSIAANPTLQAFTGRTFDLTTVGGLTAWRIGGLGGLLIGLMNIIVVVRHTRAEEEAGRLELLGAGAVGRYAPLTAGLVLALGADLVVGLVVGVGLVLVGQPAGGSFVLGLALAVVGAAFAGVAAITAQLAETSRAATGLASTVLGLAYLLRAIGDSGSSGDSWLSWVSPIGWGQQIRPFAGDRWWVFGLPIGFAALTCGIAFALGARRDLGAGLLPSRPGPATAGRALRGPLGLALRLHRGSLLGWLGAFVVVGAVVGIATQDLTSVVTGNAQLQRIIDQLGGSGGIADAFLSAIMGLLGLLGAVFTVQTVLRLRAEETGLRAEPVLATGVGRVPFAASHLAVAALGSALLLVAGGASAGLAYGLRTGDVGGQLSRVLVAAVVQLPAAWVLAGVAMALFGLLPGRTSAGWAAVVLCFLLGQLGPSLHLPQWAMDVSPFTHVPKLPSTSSDVSIGLPVGWLIAVAVLLAVAGLAGFRRRDVG
jgi:ABC-2 type transport system permease protein